MAEMHGLCAYCGKVAKHICRLCGKQVCGDHFDSARGICSAPMAHIKK